MPNWCENEVFIVGTEEDISKFTSQIKIEVSEDGSEFAAILPSFVPMPENPPKVSHMPGWWDWCVKNWGTKWGDCYTRMERLTPTQLVLSFETAWGPALAGFDVIAKLWPSLRFSYVYVEPGMEFSGMTAWIGGERISDTYSEYDGSVVGDTMPEHYPIEKEEY